MKSIPTLFISTLVAAACTTAEPDLLGGYHRLELQVNDSLWLPVGLEIPQKIEDNWTLHNGTEEIVVTDYFLSKDSIFIQMPVFPSYFTLSKKQDNWMGTWHNLDRGPEYTMTTRLLPNQRLDTHALRSTNNWKNNWKFTFNVGSDSSYYGQGEFSVHDGILSGSVLKTSGDMRYLTGYQEGNNFKLFTFDGAHAYTLTGQWIGTDSLSGTYTSGNHFSTSFGAKIKPDFEVADGDTITTMALGESTLHFSLPDANGHQLSLADERFKGKPVVVQILGSWCPNCMDESRLLQELYEKYHGQGLEIIGIALERSEDPLVAWKVINKMRKDLNLTYPLLFGGKAGEGAIHAVLPEITGPAHYPTSLYLDGTHQVVAIHTGFAGPGTSKYPALRKKIEDKIKTLVAEGGAK